MYGRYRVICWRGLPRFVHLADPARAVQQIDSGFQYPGIVQSAYSRIGHPQFFALIDIGRALHAVKHHRQHFGGLHAEFAFIAKTRHDARLIVVTPEQRIPCMVVHTLLPVSKNLLELDEIRFCQRPFFPIGIIDFQMVKIERHGEFTTVQRGVATAVFQRGR